MPRLTVAILWHMHQPCYRVPDSRAFRLPWVRLHALKDYADMPRLLSGFPGVHCTFNLVPVLLDQLASYADGSATDAHLELTRRPAENLSEGERCLILRDFFMANWQTMIRTHPRYWELLEKRGFHFRDGDLPRIAQRFSSADLLDLQMWFNLGWTDPLHVESRPALGELARKGRGFTEDDKALLLAQQQEIIAGVIPGYVLARDSGQIELSTTPYYHPILPLLCDTDVARECMPQATLPARFAYPQDAKRQITRGLDCAERLLGARPRGMWPSEGSVSGEAVALMAGAGVGWLATDEAILQKSPAGAGLSGQRSPYQPYHLPGGESPAIFFRDRLLSDLIGFSYAGWDPVLAARDMVGRLETIAGRLGADAGRHIVPVILDGENCWESYAEDGNAFLRSLYGQLSASTRLQCRTFSEFLEQEHATGSLAGIFPGSWINGDFGIWIGQPEDNAAWDLLGRARAEVERMEASLDPATREAVFEELYAAEGSDWCWWYGGDFTSENLEDFDFLFRAHLQKIYRLLGIDVPGELAVPIARTKPDGHLLQEPVNLISPLIDGMVTDFYEWAGAGLYDVWHEGGTMHRSQSLLRSMYYGFDLNNLYLRLDGSDHLLDPAKLPGLSVVLDVKKPAAMKLTIPVTGKALENGCIAAIGQLIEVKVPFALLAAGKQGGIEFFVSLHSNGQELERHPVQRPMVVHMPDKAFTARNWQA